MNGDDVESAANRDESATNRDEGATNRDESATNRDESATNRDEGAAAIGSVAEEAMKLFGALSDWAKEHGDGVGDGVAGMAAGAAQAFHEVNEHVATGAEECRYCPVCRAVHTVRELSPEVKTHLAVAGSNLLQAAAALMSTAVSDEARGSARGARDPGVEHIPVDEDWPAEPPPGPQTEPPPPFGEEPPTP